MHPKWLAGFLNHQQYFVMSCRWSVVFFCWVVVSRYRGRDVVSYGFPLLMVGSNDGQSS